MTRINLVPPSELSDNHLKAEIWELPRLFPLIGNSLGKTDLEIPDTYRLGKGHMKFFYDKLEFLHKRYEMICVEAINRGIKIETDPMIDPAFFDRSNYGPEFHYRWNDYEPTEEALALNRSRLAERSSFSGGSYK